MIASIKAEAGGDVGLNNKRKGLGCAMTLAGVNTLLMGLLALGFATGPYSSQDQEIWYRYGSLGFLLGGAILPAAALLSGARRSPALIIALTVWMLAALVSWAAYAFNSGGGV